MNDILMEMVNETLMNRQSNEHICEVCCRPSHQHDPEVNGIHYLAPLCCPGCPCGSYEEAMHEK